MKEKREKTSSLTIRTNFKTDRVWSNTRVENVEILENLLQIKKKERVRDYEVHLKSHSKIQKKKIQLLH